MYFITKELIDGYMCYLAEEEKSASTIDKYVRDIKAFDLWLGNREVNRAAVLRYKERMMHSYAPVSVNSHLSSLNSFFSFCGWYGLNVKSVKIQRQIFLGREKELTKSEYERLLTAAKQKKNERLYMLMQTICSTGIRVSELRFITVESLKRERTVISNKGKTRLVFLPKELCRILKAYANVHKITSGCVFRTKGGKPLDRSNIWTDMKKLCKNANVPKSKVFPHNLRHLFARTYYSIQKDIVRLADILGHSSVNTTRIYTMESGEIHQKQIQRLGLLKC